MNSELSERTLKTAGDSPETTRGGRVYRPPTDILETKEGISLMLELPGVSCSDVDITLEKRVLTIRGKVNLTEFEQLELTYAEYGEGDLARAFTLSDDFDPDTIEAVMRNGVLTVTLARAESAKPKKIEVRAA